MESCLDASRRVDGLTSGLSDMSDPTPRSEGASRGAADLCMGMGKGVHIARCS